MLRSLQISNFAVIESLSLEFGPGLNIFTGETGAGKSILIEALGFLLGARGSSSWLRAGAERLSVSGTFDQEDFPKELRAQFKIGGAPGERSPVRVVRELDVQGRTRALINSQSAPIAMLAAWGDRLVDFHGQHEHQALLKSAVQLECLDRFGELSAQTEEVAERHRRWSALCAERDSAQLSEEERLRRMELYRFQLQEIAEVDPKPGEEEELEAALPRLKNAERLKTLASSAYDLLYEKEGSIAADLLKVGRSLSEVARLEDSMKSALAAVEGARLSLEEVARNLGRYRNQLELEGPNRLDEILSRQDRIARLKKKYGATVSDILAARDRAAKELEALENAAQRRGELDRDLALAQAALAAACENIHASRVKTARKLETALKRQLKGLGLPQADFSVTVEMEEGRWTRAGADAVEYLLAANPGEPLKPVKDVASGGELSRVMLALKTVLAAADGVPVLVFDEVDAGVGGVVARAVGERLAALGRARQIFCVTHLPQVACFGARHFLVAKDVSGARTKVLVERLSEERRLETIALMLGGREMTAASRRHAQELLESCNYSAPPTETFTPRRGVKVPKPSPTGRASVPLEGGKAVTGSL